MKLAQPEKNFWLFCKTAPVFSGLPGIEKKLKTTFTKYELQNCWCCSFDRR